MFSSLILNVGFRFDQFSTFGDSETPRVGLIYQPWKKTTWKYLYGQAFRGPNAYENYYASVSNKRNPNLGPETTVSHELVWEQQIAANFRTTASVFHNDIRGLIGYQQDPVDQLYYFGNLDGVIAKGAEFEIETRLAKSFLGRASYGYTYAEDTATGQRISNSPEHLAKLSVSAPVWPEKVFASCELQFMSSRTTVSGGEVGAVWLANATLFTRELVPGLELSATLYNLLGQHLSRSGLDGFYPGQHSPRWAVVSRQVDLSLLNQTSL